MRKKTLFSIYAATALLLSSCGCGGSSQQIIAENFDVAEQQTERLLRASLETGSPRIPSTFINGEIDFVPTDDWVSGFFAGTLWYLYEYTGDHKWREGAIKHTELLDSIQYLTWHHDVGFMINCSYGNALRLTDNKAYEKVLVTTAESLSTRFHEAPGTILSWNVDRGWQGERGWKYPVIIDNMMNLELMFEASILSGNDKYSNIAIRHADRTIKEQYRPDGSTYHVVDFDPITGDVRRRCTAQGYADESAWARGQTWSLYGYATCYRYTKDKRYLDQAMKSYDFIFNHRNLPSDLVPYWDYNAPNIPHEPRDVSSAAITASALYEIYTYTKNEEHRKKADKIIESLSTDAYRAKVGENGGFILMHSVGSIPHGSNIDVPLNYADYYFLEALLRKQKIDNGESLF
ncbi:MAG: glycoside hydrolase family 88 protein [Rikenellaceae bacterium]